MNTDTEQKYSWSTDEETFRDHCESIDAAVAAAIDYHGGEVEIGSNIYVGEVLEIDTQQLVSADSIIDNISCQAFDVAGEASEDYLAFVTDEQKKELERLVAEWAERVEKPTFWRVGSTVAHVVTAEDLEPSNG